MPERGLESDPGLASIVKPLFDQCNNPTDLAARLVPFLSPEVADKKEAGEAVELGIARLAAMKNITLQAAELELTAEIQKFFPEAKTIN